MLRTEAVSPELLGVLRQLMELESLRSFRLVGGTALALQLGHRESVDIDLFSSNEFPTEDICNELEEKFNPEQGIRFAKEVMIVLKAKGVKIDIVNDKKIFIRHAIIEDGIRMASLEEISAMKIKTTCDPFSGRKTQKDLADIATLLDTFTVKEMIEFFKEKYPTMSPYSENVILQLSKDFDVAERKSIMPKMFNGLTWEKTKQKIGEGLKDYFDGIIQEREIILKRKSEEK